MFDASAKSTNGRRLQKDIFDILLKWRLWRYVMMADVEKIYRQVRVAEKHQTYQHIVWREKKDEPIKEYRLTTVTYGTASAPFLAIRSLFHIADSCSNVEITQIIKQDFYMNDLINGSETIERAQYIRHSIQTQLLNYGFNLRKRMSNNRRIIEDIDETANNEIIQIKDDESVKTLGLHWDPAKDDFKFHINFVTNNIVTRRHALAEVAIIFDT